MDRLALARTIDHTILKPEATEQQVRRIVDEAVRFRFASVCVNPRWVHLVSELLHAAGADDPASKSPVACCGCIGFPLGANLTTIKAIEASSAVKDGAHEIDMVIFLPALLAGDFHAARLDVLEVTRAARSVWPRAVVKVILETAVLNEVQVELGCRAAREGGADFVKTSTGFHPAGGASVQAVKWLKQHSGGLKIKAAGGIRDLPAALNVIEAGADRIGCSASVAIVESLHA